MVLLLKRGDDMESELIRLCRQKMIDLTIRYDQHEDAYVLRFEKNNKIFGRILPRNELNTTEILPKTLADMLVTEAEEILNH